MGKIKIKKNDVWIDMTPMSDVMVLLLTFFMLSVNFTKNEVVKVITPGSTTMAKVSSSAVLDITIDPEGRVLMSTDKTITMQKALDVFPEEQLVGATPYRYVRLDMTSRQQSFTTAGTDFDEVQKTSPYFSVEGEYPREDKEILVGKEIADTIGAKVGS